MIYYAKTHTGIRKNNEDSLFAPQGADGFFAVVADGMGGHNAGEVASRIVVDTVAAALKGADPEKITRLGVKNMLVAANKAVYDNAVANPERMGMGSTATAAVFSSDKAIIGQIGDSRAYLLSDERFLQITKDHSYVQLLVDNGYITHDQAQYHPQKNIITRAIGTDKKVDIDVFNVPLKNGDIILLCSDGLNGAVDDDTIASILRSDIETAPDQLIDKALSNGGSDNISIVIAVKGGGKL